MHTGPRATPRAALGHPGQRRVTALSVFPQADPGAPERDLTAKWRAVAGINLAVLVWLLVGPAGRAQVAMAANVVGPLLACWWCLPGRGRTALSNLPPLRARLSCLCFFLATAAFAFGRVLDYNYPCAPGGAPYFVDYPLVIAGILLLPLHNTSAAMRGRVLVDSLMTVTALATFSWYFLLGPILARGAESTLGAVIATACPVFDLVMLFFLLQVSARAQSAAERRVIVPLSLGLLGMVVGDTVRAYQTLHGMLEIGTALDVFPPLSYMLVALGARTQWSQWSKRRTGEAPDAPAVAAAAAARPVTQWRLLLPYALMPATIGLLSYVYYHPHAPWLTGGVYTGATLL